MDSNLKKVKIFDANFSHAKYSTDHQTSKFIEWYRDENLNLEDTTFFTDNFLNLNIGNSENRIGWLLEPPSVNPYIYNFIKTVNNNFKNVLTYNKDLLDIGENYLFYPHGGCWIPKEKQKIYEKSKLVSIISSNKKTTHGHKLRHVIIDKFKDVIILILGITLLLVYFLLKSFEIHQLDSTDLFWRIARHDYFIVILFVSILLIISSLEFIYKSHLTSLSKFSTWIGDLTYSTYLLHVPIQILLLTIIQYLELDQLKIANEIWFFLLYLFFIVALGRLSYSKFEKPARKYLRGKL